MHGYSDQRHQVVKMVQLTKDQGVFVVKTFFETGSLQATQDAFRVNFPDRDPPVKSTIWSNVKKYQDHGTSQNRNNGNSGRRRTVRTAENVEAVRQQLQQYATATRARRDGLGVSKTTFNRWRTC